jgi:hypothetical protein
MKFENIQTIQTPYSVHSMGQSHFTPIYRFDFVPEIDLLTLKSNINGAVNDGRTTFVTEKSNPYIDTLHKNMMKCVKDIFCSKNDLGEIMQQHWWWLNENTFDTKCHLYTIIVEDRKGHLMTSHVDNPRVLATFIINLTDNQSSTEFVDYKDTNKVIYKAEIKKNTGLLFFNTGGCVHKITVIDEVRYVLLGSILLNMVI